MFSFYTPENTRKPLDDPYLPRISTKIIKIYENEDEEDMKS